MIHDRNHFARNNIDAWDTYIKLKRRTDVKVSDLMKREAALESSVAAGKREFAELSDCTEQLIEDTRQLQKVVNQQKKDSTRLESELQEKAAHAKKLDVHVSELEDELSDANHTLAMQQELIEEIERSRDTAKTFETRFESVSQERDEAHRAVIHLTSLISGQIAYIERVLGTFVTPSRPTSRTDNRNSRRRSFQPTTNQANTQQPLSHSRRKTMDSPTQNSPRSPSTLSQVECADEEPSLKEKVGLVAATVRKINIQCHAAIQELADKRNELDAPGALPNDSEDHSDDLPESPLGSEHTEIPHNIPRQFTPEKEETHHDRADTASVTRSTAQSALSSTPDLDSSASTVRSESAASRDEYSTPPPNAAPEPTIHSIMEEDEDDLIADDDSHVVFLDANSMKSPHLSVQGSIRSTQSAQMA